VPDSLEEMVHELLCRLPAGGLAVARQLVCDTLHYAPAGERLPRDDWPEAARPAVSGDPLLLARHTADDGQFDVIYAQVPALGTGGGGGGPCARLSWAA